MAATLLHQPAIVRRLGATAGASSFICSTCSCRSFVSVKAAHGKPKRLPWASSTTLTSIPQCSSTMDDIVAGCFRWSYELSSKTSFHPVRRDMLEDHCNVLDGGAIPTLDELLTSVRTSLQGERAFVLVDNSERWAPLLPELVAGLTGADALTFKGNASRALRKHAGDETRKIYLSTALHPSITLPQHCEAAYHNAYPKAIAFYCKDTDIPTTSNRQGATPITELREVFCKLPEHVRLHFEHEGVSFRRYLPSPQNKVAHSVKQLVVDAGLGSFIPISTWADVFDCETREELEVTMMQELGISDIQFLDDDSVIYTVHKDVASDPVWLSPLNFLRFCGTDEQEARQLLDLLSKAVQEADEAVCQEDLEAFVDLLSTYNCTVGWPFYSDGSRIPEMELAKVREAVHDSTMRFPWKKGSMVVIDNTRAMHGREHFDDDNTRIITTSFA